MGRVEHVVDTRIITSFDLLGEIQQLQNKLKVRTIARLTTATSIVIRPLI